MEQLTKNQAVATSQEAVQNQNEPQLRDENAHNDKSVHGVLNPTYQAGLRRSEERFSRNAETDLVCRLLREKNNISFLWCTTSYDADIRPLRVMRSNLCSSGYQLHATSQPFPYTTLFRSYFPRSCSESE